MELIWHRYSYYPYERELARREAMSLLSFSEASELSSGLVISPTPDLATAKRLVYFSAVSDKDQITPTLQASLEQVNGSRPGRQSTRYSAHGLHEYKGKFNPQVVRAILNILKIDSDGLVLDPFCGSGTALLECAHAGIEAVGIDINPLAIFLANTKLAALRVPAEQATGELRSVLSQFREAQIKSADASAERFEYLSSWFEDHILDAIERLRSAILHVKPSSANLFFAVASNLLRDYSLQDPSDLRIRRRKTPIPEKPFIEAFAESATKLINKIFAAQGVLLSTCRRGRAILGSSQCLAPGQDGVPLKKFHAAVTSPPYATALPYIDTQRLSLVWLGLIAPSEVLKLEASLIGSREVRGVTKSELRNRLDRNADSLPLSQADYCRELQAALKGSDGFRRQAVPLLLYRYFKEMGQVFRAVRRCMEPGAPFALIVGSNHTTLGGRRFDIDTPGHLAQLAKANGWEHEESMPLQTYKRFGLHATNAVASEALVVIRAA
jgi:site-specific DNA-methyltransferase (cytosine-N4-specific)